MGLLRSLNLRGELLAAALNSSELSKFSTMGRNINIPQALNSPFPGFLSMPWSLINNTNLARFSNVWNRTQGTLLFFKGNSNYSLLFCFA